jgi:hypothetical protein
MVALQDNLGEVPHFWHPWGTSLRRFVNHAYWRTASISLLISRALRLACRVQGAQGRDVCY